MRILALALVALVLQEPVKDEGREKIAREVLMNVEALPAKWADEKFWIVTDGKRSGWVRYEVKREKFAGEHCFAVDYERANSRGPSERFRMHVKINDLLSPRGFAYGKSLREFKVEGGKVGNSPFGAAADPGNLVSFPEMLATILPQRPGVEFKFSTLDHDEKVYGGGTFVYNGTQAQDGKECHGYKAAYTVCPFNAPERHESEIWVRPDRKLALVKSTITWRFDNEQLKRTEELIPVDPKEWELRTVELNEIRALAELCSIADMFLQFRAADFDGNNKNDYWVADISALYRIIPSSQKDPIEVISREAASADADAMPGGEEPGGSILADKPSAKPVPFFGYYFKVMKKFQEKTVFVALNDGTNRNDSEFAICAYPAEYGKSGHRTFMIDSSRVPYWKDLKGKPVEDRPQVPGKDGWMTGPLKN